MYAIVEIGGKQVKVEKNQKIFVNRLDAKEGSKVTFDNILLLDNAGKVVLGTPSVKGAAVEAKIVKHLKDDKVIVFKKKRRKGYKVKNGHRKGNNIPATKVPDPPGFPPPHGPSRFLAVARGVQAFAGERLV